MKPPIPVDDDVVDPRSPLVASPNRLKIGTFSINCQRGATCTLAEGTIGELDWAQQVRLARASEAAGFEAVIPVARWRGFAGPSHFLRESYEPATWAAGIAAVTSKIAVFATLHVPLVHPLRVAKEMTTIDHISGGRFAVNIVCGWNVAEFAMFGHQQRDHDDRYAQGAEWVRFVKALWSSTEEFDWEGDYYSAKGAISEPRPIQRRPMIMSAGSSPAGRDFAATHCDINFVTAAADMGQLAAMVADIRARARARGRSVQVWMYVGMLCADTEREVRRQYDYFVHEKGDWEAAEDSIRAIAGGGVQSLDVEMSAAMKERIIAWYGAHQVMGTPEQIVEQLAALSAAGVDGIATTWVDYENGIEIFREKILPLAISAGLRTS